MVTVPKHDCFRLDNYSIFLHLHSDVIKSSVQENMIIISEFRQTGKLQKSLPFSKVKGLILTLPITGPMLITTPHMSKNVITPPVVTINNVPLPKCQFTKLLGVVIDSKLKWDKHIEYLCKMVNPKIGIIHRLRPILPTLCLNLFTSLWFSLI